MMGHRQVGQAELFYEFSLDRHVTADHLLLHWTCRLPLAPPIWLRVLTSRRLLNWHQRRWRFERQVLDFVRAPTGALVSEDCPQRDGRHTRWSARLPLAVDQLGARRCEASAAAHCEL